MPNGRPNIVLITTDQHRADCYSFARPDIKTPHIDQLAASGTRFERCYCPAPLCQPARASLLTGMLPHTHGVRDNGIDIPEDMFDRGFGAQAANAGYKTALLGKAHLSTQHTFQPTGRAECRHTMSQYYEGWDGPYMGFDHVELFVDGPVKWPSWEPPLGLHYTKWLYTGGQNQEFDAQYYQGSFPESEAQQVHVPELALSWHTSSWLGDKATSYIENQPETDDPFLLWVSFPDPHHPFDAPSPWNAVSRPEDMVLPAHRQLDLENRPWWHEASMNGTPQTTEEFRHIRENLSRQKAVNDTQLRDIMTSYFGMISLVDHQVGRIVAALSRQQLLEDTIIIVTSDHGEFLGDHGLLFKGPMFYDSLIRVGFIASGPGIAANKVVNEVVSTIDLAPTIVDICGNKPARYHGHSLVPLFSDPNHAATHTTDGREEHVHVEWGLEASRCGVELDLHTVVSKNHRYTIELGSGAGELYDLQNDPDEMNNLFEDTGSRSVVDEMEERRRTRPDDKRTTPLPIVGMC